MRKASAILLLLAATCAIVSAASHPQSGARDSKNALAGSSSSQTASIAIAQNLASLGKCDEAAHALAELGALRSEKALTLLGVCRFRAGEFSQAITQLRQAASLAPGYKRARIFLARAYAGAGDNEQGIETLKAWTKAHPGDVDALYWIGQFYQNMAGETFQQMQAKDSRNYLVYETEGNQYRARQQYPQALDAYKKALTLAPPGTAGLHFRLGDVYWRNLRFDEAKKELEQELALNPYHSKANYELGDIDAKEGRPQEAAGYLQKALALDPGLTEAHRSLGRVYLEEKVYSQALAEFLQVAKAEPNDHTIHALLATTYRDMGRLNEAKQEAQLSQRLENQTIQTIESNKAAEQKMGSHL
ncbi:MAG TPA: tetratricopeptide repeat protein [Terriglobia bacterium]|nr:tetratricopeptide repeat protein [Terriglobia bacterium]